MSDETTAVVRISGRVQGVGFRIWTEREARRLGLAGWVRNEPDGDVTACLAGPPQAVSAMVDRLHQGPPGALVSKVESLSAAGTEASPGFRILR